MRWLLTFSVLALGAAMGLILASTLRAYTDPHHAAFLLGAAGRNRPPGAILRHRDENARPNRYMATGAMRGLQLRNQRKPAVKKGAIIPFTSTGLSTMPSQLKNTEVAPSCGCEGA